MGFALCVQVAALSWILNTQYGLNIEEIGYVWLAGPLAGILGQVIIGLISDNVWFWGGRRRPFIIIGGTIAAMMILALPYIDVINDRLGVDSLVGVAITIALLLDLAINISFNPARSIIADVTPAGAARTKGYTWMQTISGFFGVLAYLIGAFISNYTLIYVGAGLVFLFAVFPVLFIQEPKVLADAEAEPDSLDVQEAMVTNIEAKSKGQAAKAATDWPEFLKICFAHAFTWVGVQCMFIYTFAFIKEEIMGFDTTATLSATQNNEIGFSIGVAFAILNTVGFLLPATVLEPIAKRIGRVKTHALALLVSALGYVLIVFFGQSITAFFVLMAIVGVGWAAVVSLPFAIMSEVVDQKRMGWFMGLFNLSVVLPQIVSSNLGGYIGGQADKSIIFWIAAGTLGVSALLWFLVREQEA
ncbi:MFS transporter [Lewinellaceae bacterium SD302]|nr:MFS transporter [Lewinellaceae bacterium SD302]